jgi:hypothetical protein
MRILVLLFSCTLCILTLGSADGVEPRGTLSRQGAIEIARAEAEKRGLISDDPTIVADEANTEWNKFLKSSSAARNKYREILASKRYQAVYFGRRSVPRVLKGGGDAFVLVDLDQGKVIDVIDFK